MCAGTLAHFEQTVRERVIRPGRRRRTGGGGECVRYTAGTLEANSVERRRGGAREGAGGPRPPGPPRARPPLL